MYITRVEIENIRSIKHLVWEIDATNAPGWHVILGDNGSGKSTFVRALAATLVGLPEIAQLGEDWSKWVSAKVYNQLIERVRRAPEINSPGGRQYVQEMLIDFSFFSSRYIKVHKFGEGWEEVVNFSLGLNIYAVAGRIDRVEYKPLQNTDNDLDDKGIKFIDKPAVDFSASYGPFRRFSEGNQKKEHLHENSSILSRHLSAFGDDISLTKGLEWLGELQFKILDPTYLDNKDLLILNNVKTFINQKDFLPYGSQLTEVTSSGVKFRDGNGNEINVEEMSDGYRSVLSLTFELLRQLSIAYGPDIFETHDDGKVTVKVPGVVQIDEVDAHLHPTWQKRIGFWFREHFPQMQFIVTTHSPLVCQAAEKGSIFLLPRPGTEETGRMLEGAERDRLIYGDITDAYSTEAFGGGDTRSPAGQAMLERLGGLNVKEMLHGLTKAEEQEQERLRLALPSSATELP